MTINQTRAAEVAAATTDAYSFERYGAKAWEATALALFALGLSARGVEAVLRSKWMRWAADAAGNKRPDAVAVVRWIQREYPNERRLTIAIDQLIAQTFDD